MAHKSKRNRLPVPVTRQTGLGLMEILVTILVVSVGLLGLAALQVNGLRNNQEAYLRTVASQLAVDIADRLRANLRAARAGNYEGRITPTEPASAPDCGANNCTPEEMASYDRKQLADLLSSTGGRRPVLPEGEIEVKALTTTGSTAATPYTVRRFQVQVRWGALNDRVTMEFTL